MYYLGNGTVRANAMAFVKQQGLVDSIEVGPDSLVSRGKDGAWVEAWIYVPYEQEEDSNDGTIQGGH